MWLARYGVSMLSAITMLTIIVAAIFGYFEQLLNQENPAKVLEEIDRLETFNTSFPAIGLKLDDMVEFMQPAFDLLNKIHETLESEEKGDIMLLQTMNSDESNSILYYFKVYNARGQT